MAIRPYNTIDEMLAHVKNAKALDANHPEQQNALLNKFNYKKYVSSKNQTIIVKEFNESSYNGPTTNDFIERLNSLYEAAEKTLGKEQLAKLNEAKNITLKKINIDCAIEPLKTVDELLSKEKDLIRKIDKAKYLLHEFMCRAIFIINADAFKSNTQLTELLNTIANNESSIIAAKGRPNFINYYPINDCMRVSINRVIGNAIPSTERTLPKLPNFVECGIGYMDGSRYVSQFKGYRHSSYTPIKMIDKQYGDSNYELVFGNRKKLLAAVNGIKFDRRKAAALCAKDMFAELARQQIATGVNVDKPIEIHLSSLAMLSPIKGDKTFLRRGESEHRQLKESYNALMMYNGREVVLDIDGKKVTVKPTINMMNAASNWHGIIASKYMPSVLEKNINAEGMNSYIAETEKYLNHALYFGLRTQDPLSDQREDETAPLLHAVEKKLTRQLAIKDELTSLYRSLDDYLNKPKNASTDPTYITLLKSIDTLRHKMYHLEHDILNQRMAILKERRAEIQVFLNHLSTKETSKSKDEEIAELYYQSLFMYMDKKLEPAQFGARYLLVNEKMGNAVDFYCKSGEDRTGRMQNLIEELCEFSREKGYFPRYDLDKQAIDKSDEARQKNIAKIVSERSVSRDNTNANARGARGLQITSALALNTGLPNFSDCRMGTLARGVYDSVALKKLWRVLHKLLVNVKTTAMTMKNRFFEQKQELELEPLIGKNPSSNNKTK